MTIFDVIQAQRRLEMEANRERARLTFEAEKVRAQKARTDQRNLERACTKPKELQSAFPVAVVTKAVLRKDGTPDRRFKAGVLWDPYSHKVIRDHEVNAHVARTSMTLARRATSEACLAPPDEVRESRKEHHSGLMRERGGTFLDVGDAGEWDEAYCARREMRRFEGSQ